MAPAAYFCWSIASSLRLWSDHLCSQYFSRVVSQAPFMTGLWEDTNCYTYKDVQCSGTLSSPQPNWFYIGPGYLKSLSLFLRNRYFVASGTTFKLTKYVAYWTLAEIWIPLPELYWNCYKLRRCMICGPHVTSLPFKCLTEQLEKWRYYLSTPINAISIHSLMWALVEA